VGPDATQVLTFAEALARQVAAAHPKQLTTEARIANRRGRVYVDPFRNAFAQTVVAPYSVRRRPGAPVSTPLAWSEVSSRMDPGRFNLRTFGARLRGRDPWQDFFRRRQPLEAAMEAVRRA
jgi:bifunctional non-homologous end joining protein LigD